MDYRITGLPLAHFASLRHLDDDALRALGATRRIVDAPNAYPCRITLEDAAPGEEVLLLTYAHQPAGTPYASAGPIFIRRRFVRKDQKSAHAQACGDYHRRKRTLGQKKGNAAHGRSCRGNETDPRNYPGRR